MSTEHVQSEHVHGYAVGLLSMCGINGLMDWLFVC